MPRDRAGRCLVTGAAGFIGSHLSERLLAEGHEVTGVDCFTDYYERSRKEANLDRLRGEPGFRLVEADLVDADLAALLSGVRWVFHEAGQPGVRGSWGRSFEPYVRLNVLATQRLLEAAREAPELERFVYASSSSVYGDAEELPVSESALPKPVSPYGVTKLAAEHLCTLYARLGVPTVSLRYFTVYGPRQRPDMAFHRFLRAVLGDAEIQVNGDGEQTRDFTFIADIVEANLAAARAPAELVRGRAYNLGGGSRVSVNHVLEVLAAITGRSPRVRYDRPQPGDARHTFADTSAARADLGFNPRTGLEQGLRAEAEWVAEEVLAV